MTDPDAKLLDLRVFLAKYLRRWRYGGYETMPYPGAPTDMRRERMRIYWSTHADRKVCLLLTLYGSRIDVDDVTAHVKLAPGELKAGVHRLNDEIPHVSRYMVGVLASVTQLLDPSWVHEDVLEISFDYSILAKDFQDKLAEAIDAVITKAKRLTPAASRG